MPVNKVIMVGRLTAEPELKTTTQGTPVMQFSLALNRGKGETDFFDFTAWRNTAEFIHRYFHKGDGMGVVGHLSARSYEKNGEKKTVYSVVADEVFFPEGKRSDNAGTNTTPLANVQQSGIIGAVDVQPNYVDVANDEDLPF